MVYPNVAPLRFLRLVTHPKMALFKHRDYWMSGGGSSSSKTNNIGIGGDGGDGQGVLTDDMGMIGVLQGNLKGLCTSNVSTTTLLIIIIIIPQPKELLFQSIATPPLHPPPFPSPKAHLNSNLPISRIPSSTPSNPPLTIPPSNPLLKRNKGKVTILRNRSW